MRTASEILARIEHLKASGTDFFNFQQRDIIFFLPFEDAKPFLKEGTTADQWEDTPPTADTIKTLMLDYMPFAWDKANNCRGLSAARSVAHMKAWLWLLGDDLADKLDGIYEYYGKPCLRVVCEKYGWDWRQWDDGEWRNSEDDDPVSPPDSITV